MLRSADSFLAICEKFDSGNDEAEIRQWRLGSKNSWRMSWMSQHLSFCAVSFVIAIHETSIMVALKKPFLASAMWITFRCGAIGMAFLSVKNEAKHICQLLLPGIFFLLHLSYGVGSVVGMGKMIKDKITKK